jgi:hypothetical protein
MAIVVFVMGSFVGLTGFRGRVVEDKDAAIKSRSDHRKLAPWMFLFMALGYSKRLKAIFFEAIASNVESTVILVRGAIKS